MPFKAATVWSVSADHDTWWLDMELPEVLDKHDQKALDELASHLNHLEGIEARRFPHMFQITYQPIPIMPKNQ